CARYEEGGTAFEYW
nr:immunoglobulin heavy chain junction region [Macaca mulatta]MOX61527.1 immunoglobulin heavy chain junction region [Macaca mulatta]